MSDTTNDIDWLLKTLDPNEAKHLDPWEAVIRVRDCPRHHAALTALLAERDGLKQRVAELKAALKPSNRDLRERNYTMQRWMNQVTGMLCQSMTHSHDAKQELVTRCDTAIAAMWKGEE